MPSLDDVTVIIPLYVRNRQQLTWARECVQSAVDQGCRVLMIDDASPVDPREALKDFANETTLFMRDDNLGVGATRNQLAEAAETDLIFPLDCDDQLVMGTISELLNLWTGKPLYTDVEMFGERAVEHFVLKDFDCEALSTAVGLASVSVLHSKKQWRKVGGWREDIELYEDGEYNARLFAEYCALRYGKPLVRYRQHAAQRSKHDNGAAIARDVHQRYILQETLSMARGCCGKGSSNNKQSQPQAVTQQSAEDGGKPKMFHSTTTGAQPTALPGEEDERIKARYMGGEGKGTHYHQGKGTGYRYKVQHGGVFMVDPRDAVFEESKIGVGPGRGLFLALEQPKEASQDEDTFRPSEEVTKEPSAKEPRVASSKKSPVTEEVEEFVATHEILDVPDIHNMTIDELKASEDITPEAAKKLLQMERAGKNRKGAISYLRKVING